MADDNQKRYKGEEKSIDNVNNNDSRYNDNNPYDNSSNNGNRYNRYNSPSGSYNSRYGSNRYPSNRYSNGYISNGYNHINEKLKSPVISNNSIYLNKALTLRKMGIFKDPVIGKGGEGSFISICKVENIIIYSIEEVLKQARQLKVESENIENTHKDSLILLFKSLKFYLRAYVMGVNKVNLKRQIQTSNDKIDDKTGDRKNRFDFNGSGNEKDELASIPLSEKDMFNSIEGMRYLLRISDIIIHKIKSDRIKIKDDILKYFQFTLRENIMFKMVFFVSKESEFLNEKLISGFKTQSTTDKKYITDEKDIIKNEKDIIKEEMDKVAGRNKHLKYFYRNITLMKVLDKCLTKNNTLKRMKLEDFMTEFDIFIEKINCL